MKLMSQLLLALALAASATAAGPATIEFDPANLTVDASKLEIRFDDYDLACVGEELSLPCRSYLLPLSAPSTAAAISFEVLAAEPLDCLPPGTAVEDTRTGINRAQTVLPTTTYRSGFGQLPVHVVGQTTMDGTRYLELLVFPVTCVRGCLEFNRQVAIRIGDNTVEAELLVLREDIQSATPAKDGTVLSSNWLGETVYTVITNAELAPVLQELVDYRRSIGMEAELVTVEEIVSQYSGRDDAERVRNYLIDFYAAGGEYCLLGGDETVVPIRYACYFNADDPVDPYYLQICDLYYADLTGNWDVDDDDIWGEPNDDDADIVPELRVGRVPLDTQEEMAAWIEKVIIYETNPGYGDASYLESMYFMTTDQMRDYSSTGQHKLVSEHIDGRFFIDTLGGVEQPSGEAADPTSLAASELIDTLARGFGVVNIQTHGNYARFDVRSSEYGKFPISWFASVSFDAPHACIGDLPPNGRVGIYYSMACDNAAFDTDQPPFNEWAPCVAEACLATPEAGAVAYIGQTRWGWVGSSHRMHMAFYDSLFADPERRLIDAVYAAKNAYYYVRDMVYGMNYFGDPTTRLYDQAPLALEIETDPTPSELEVSITSDDQPVSYCQVLLSDSAGVLGTADTDGDGVAVFSLDYTPGAEYNLAAVKNGYAIAVADYSPGIVADVEDDPDELPWTWSLAQNYPNPFNPTTTIGFDLPFSTEVELNVYNSLGQYVATLAAGRHSVGRHEVVWDGTDQSGDKVSSGVYFYRLATAMFTVNKKMLLLK